ncbi:hypothetical protein AN8931.2 [Aspergillus nidulans FGSC A4]|jgi:uncharacterized protein (UPF0261 family)|uniref:UPF0261 domain protein (AFU_orthologue AFUA_1G10120) n=1 Tax=Emericella nidulans (strain FGSC A4 / ATCC 38163 / CBS 112.46 / NRRL 194 / M139) TaxID=227321 RepID=Q5ARZ9_EMENI|nr:hypothetical protein [Aspergillus nidulans FGSC A4]EAA64065.1 hypothetical protein AN8931.2 [Aspergillus nidulans FGSC A4]CBF84628.1 TPA: UPF0261 domain protein (AFU_orthologue; AFUA_1G10120) [Aspergillus nidulans FGSC A4]|eukprot:XP_682200.1 hypothetical protein AN8931.2 [Aspergillus nidulans FGSC A4]
MHLILLGTLDTKRSEVLYLHSQLHQTASRLNTPLSITLIDCGVRSEIDSDPAITVSHTDLITKYPYASDLDSPSPTKDLFVLPRGEAISIITACATKCVSELLQTQDVHGIIGVGGSGGTSLISAVMRSAAKIGLPKLIVSTVASGNTGPIVGETDLTLMYSVVDIAGSNRLLKDVLENAAGAMVGMASAYKARLEASISATPAQSEKSRLRVGVTMFGVTTPCVDTIRSHLETNYAVEVYVFHATGHGGKAMERLVEEGHLDAMLDLTTTEICDLIAGGEMACDRRRLETSLKKGIPTIISVGATDMVNFGPIETVPPKYQGRKLFVHNPSVTLMRTSREECEAVGRFIVEKVNGCVREGKAGLVEVVIPKGGVSKISTTGGVFEDKQADEALANVLMVGLEGKVRVVQDPRDVNDRGFAVDIAERLMTLVAAAGEKREKV